MAAARDNTHDILLIRKLLTEGSDDGVLNYVDLVVRTMPGKKELTENLLEQESADALAKLKEVENTAASHSDTQLSSEQIKQVIYSWTCGGPERKLNEIKAIVNNFYAKTSMLLLTGPRVESAEEKVRNAKIFAGLKKSGEDYILAEKIAKRAALALKEFDRLKKAAAAPSVVGPAGPGLNNSAA